MLLTFDGRVLEVFGLTGTHRYHIWQEPHLEFSHGRHPWLTIVLGRADATPLATTRTGSTACEPSRTGWREAGLRDRDSDGRS
ncbi:hypothetical protein SAZ11_04995 [Streptomyces sp. FXJ1.4098]|nr:hypothetical protein [Streptomyces sp. FXJ1.4098]